MSHSKTDELNKEPTNVFGNANTILMLDKMMIALIVTKHCKEYWKSAENKTLN